MEKIQNTDHVASNLCNETVIPVYVVDNASEFVRKCKPYHIIDLKSDAYEANNVKLSSSNDSNKCENTSSLMEAERSHEEIVNREEYQDNAKWNTSTCAKLYVNRACAILTNKVDSTQTPETRVNELTECTLSESLQQNKPYQMCFSSNCFSKDDNCIHSHESDHICDTNKLDKVAAYIPDDDDMCWCQKQQIDMKKFQWAMTTFDKVYAHFILANVNDANREHTISDNDRMTFCDKLHNNNTNSRQAHNKCYCSVCGRSVRLDYTVEKESKPHENNNNSNNAHAHEYGLRCVSCGCVAHLFCWGLSYTDIQYSNWKCKACECKNTIGTSHPIDKEHYQLRQQERKKVQNSKSRKVEGEIKCAFCGKGCEEGAMFRYAPYQDKTNEIHAKSNLHTKNVYNKYKIISVLNSENNSIQHSLLEKEKSKLQELTTSKIEHCLDTLLSCHAVCALTSQITNSVFIEHNDCEEYTPTNRTTQTRCESTSKLRRSVNTPHAKKHRTVKCNSSNECKRGDKEATRTNYNALHTTELVFIAHRRWMRPRDVQSLECNYCHVSDGWRVRCAHSRCFQVVHPLCATHNHAVECLSSLECNWKHTNCDTGKCNREGENKQMEFRSAYSEGNSNGEYDVKRILSNSCSSSSINQASYWTKCNVYCSQHAKFYVSPQSNYSYYSEHQNNQSSSAIFTSANIASKTKNNIKCDMQRKEDAAELLDKSSSNKIITTNSSNTRSHILSHEELNILAENAVAEYAMTMSLNTNTCNHISLYKASDISSISIKSENIKRKRGRPASVGRDAQEKTRGHDEVTINKLMYYWMCKRAQRRMESEQIMHAINITRTRPIGTAALRAELVKVTPERVKISSFMCLTPEWQQRLITEVEEYLPLPDDEYEELWSKLRPRKRALTRRECSQEECLYRLSTFTECMENMYNLSSVLHVACVQRHRCVEATLHELQWRLRNCIEGDKQ